MKAPKERVQNALCKFSRHFSSILEVLLASVLSNLSSKNTLKDRFLSSKSGHVTKQVFWATKLRQESKTGLLDREMGPEKGFQGGQDIGLSFLKTSLPVSGLETTFCFCLKRSPKKTLS